MPWDDTESRFTDVHLSKGITCGGPLHFQHQESKYLVIAELGKIPSGSLWNNHFKYPHIVKDVRHALRFEGAIMVHCPCDGSASDKHSPLW